MAIVTKPRFRPSVSTAKSRYFNNLRLPYQLSTHTLEYLVNSLEKSEEKIIVPTPALSEILVRAGTAAPEYLRRINLASVFRPASFDELCAVEVAEITKEALDSGDKRSGHDGTWAKIKYDRQIVAIAKVNNASILYSDDREIYKLGSRVGLTVIRIADLPLPPEEAQSSFTFEKKEEKKTVKRMRIRSHTHI